MVTSAHRLKWEDGGDFSDAFSKHKKVTEQMTFVTKPRDLSLIPRTHKVGESTPAAIF